LLAVPRKRINGEEENPLRTDGEPAASVETGKTACGRPAHVRHFQLPAAYAVLPTAMDLVTGHSRPPPDTCALPTKTVVADICPLVKVRL